VAKNFIKNRRGQSDYWNASVVVMMVFIVSGFAILLASMPEGFRYVGPLYDKTEYPEEYYMSKPAISGYLYNVSNKTLIEGTGFLPGELWFDFNTESSPSFNLKLYMQWWETLDTSLHRIQFFRLKGWFIVNIFSTLDWETKYKSTIGESEIVEHYQPSMNASIFQPVYDNEISVAVAFSDPNTTRNDISQAFFEREMKVSVGFGWQNQTLAYNMWEIMSRLLLFQAYEFGVDPVTNFLMVLPIWTAIIYTVARITLLIIQSVPSYGGGGGGG